MHPAALSEVTLMSECEVRRQRRSGPGGQHRNKVETAVVITHSPTGIRGEASERRSQEQNRSQAMFRLRLNLAIHIRQPREISDYSPSPLWVSRLRGGRLNISPEHDDFPGMLAEALDVLAVCQWEAKVAAEKLSCSTSQLIKFLQLDPHAITAVNHARRTTGKAVYR